DDYRGVRERAGDLRRILDEHRLEATPTEPLELRGGIADDVVRGRRQQDNDPDPPAREMARDHESVTAVAALTADDRHRPARAREPGKGLHDRVRGAAAGVFHQRRAGDSELL